MTKFHCERCLLANDGNFLDPISKKKSSKESKEINRKVLRGKLSEEEKKEIKLLCRVCQRELEKQKRGKRWNYAELEDNEHKNSPMFFFDLTDTKVNLAQEGKKNVQKALKKHQIKEVKLKKNELEFTPPLRKDSSRETSAQWLREKKIIKNYMRFHQLSTLQTSDLDLEQNPVSQASLASQSLPSSSAKPAISSSLRSRSSSASSGSVANQADKKADSNW